VEDALGGPLAPEAFRATRLGWQKSAAKSRTGLPKKTGIHPARAPGIIRHLSRRVPKNGPTYGFRWLFLPLADLRLERRFLTFGPLWGQHWGH